MRRIVAMLVIGIAVWSGCRSERPIKIGFVGCLTGRLSDLGTAGRNGVTLAVEQLNATGGINGRMLELIVKDDQQDAVVAKQVDQALINEGVIAIIGHMTSAMSVAALPIINAANIVMISPTSTTNELSGVDDYFFRTGLADKVQAEQIAQYARAQGMKTVSGLYDLSNRTFTEAWYQHFQAAFEQAGGTILTTAAFTSGQDSQYRERIQQMLAPAPDGLLFVAGALDMAMFCQQLKKFGSARPILSSGWAMTPVLIQQGGASVEGVILPQTYNEQSTHPAYLAFKQQFEQRFGVMPNFAATGGYDAAQLLIQALRETTKPAGVKRAILKQNVLHALQGDMTIDQYGDAQRKTFLFTVRNGQFVLIE